jgi:serine/threonine protein kinase
VLNDYRIISHLGKGCFSIVSSAVNKINNNKCAIKTYTRIDQMDDVRLQNIQS